MSAIYDQHGPAAPEPPQHDLALSERLKQLKLFDARGCENHGVPHCGVCGGLSPGSAFPLNERGIGPGLCDHDIEMLTRLMEEAGEVIQAASKLLIFGPQAHNPHKDVSYDNVLDLSLEVGDLHQMVEEVAQLGLIRPEGVAAGIARKKERLLKYLVTKRPSP